jgi:hypothetical protein
VGVPDSVAFVLVTVSETVRVSPGGREPAVNVQASALHRLAVQIASRIVEYAVFRVASGRGLDVMIDMIIVEFIVILNDFVTEWPAEPVSVILKV